MFMHGRIGHLGIRVELDLMNKLPQLDRIHLVRSTQRRGGGGVVFVDLRQGEVVLFYHVPEGMLDGRGRMIVGGCWWVLVGGGWWWVVGG